MSDTSDSREVWVLERNGFPALVDEDEFDCVSPHRFKHTCFQNGKRVDTESTRYIPSPTWRPIAELPKEWRDGRRVIVEDSNGDQWVAHHPSPKDVDRRWYSDGGNYLSPPIRYLDIAIPEVTHG